VASVLDEYSKALPKVKTDNQTERQLESKMVN
jgi:hypothetical protein